MSSLIDLTEIVGFFSYSREDDEALRGSLSELRDAISRELAAQLGRTKRNFRLWQDQEAIPPGTLWESQIKTAVAKASFFIAIVTPRSVNSEYCHLEISSFLDREKDLGRDDLIFPVLYIDVAALRDRALWRDNVALPIIAARQNVDWRAIRQQDINTVVVREAVERFSGKIVDALTKPWDSPEGWRDREAKELRGRAEDEERKKEAAEAEAQRRSSQAEKKKRTTRESGRWEEEEESKKEADEVEVERRVTGHDKRSQESHRWSPLAIKTTDNKVNKSASNVRSSNRDAKLRARYLQEVKRDVVDRLHASVHHARFLDLGLEDDPAGVRPPWGYYNPELGCQYESVWDAFVSCHRRLLLLGHPGAGKTTALLQIATEVIKDAEASADAPVPVIVNLSKFRLPKRSENRLGFRFFKERRRKIEETESARAFEDWIVAEIAAVPGLDSGTALRWLRDGKVAAFLDGLDEFNDTQRGDLARTLNTTFLRDHADLNIVICSRTNEYEILKRREDSRLQLRGCVQLQPLTDDQVAEYLRAAEADALLNALPDDAALRELSRTPLTLSMLVLAYGGQAPAALAKGTSLSETRSQLFESYVARMLQRQARRDYGVPFDDVPANDVPVARYRYRPDAVNRWLGWLAIMMSVRMRTTFSPRALVRMLLAATEPRRQLINSRIAYAAVGLLVAISLVIAAVPIVPPKHEGSWTALIVVAGAWALTILIPTTWARMTRARVTDRGRIGTRTGFRRSEERIDLRRIGAYIAWFLTALSLFALLVFSLSASIGIISHLLSNLTSNNISALDFSTLFAFGMLELIFILDDDTRNPHVAIIAYAILFLLPFFLIFIINYWNIPSAVTHNWTDYSRSKELTTLAALWIYLSCLLIYSLIKALKNEGISTYMTLFLLSTLYAGVCGFATWMIVAIDEMLVFVTLAAWAVIVCVVSSVGTQESIYSSAMFIVGASILVGAGGVFAGGSGAILAAVVSAALPAAVTGVFGAGATRSMRKVADRGFGLFDSLLLSRFAWILLALFRRLPYTERRFLNSSVDAFLLKRSTREFEFIHRLLRDYFALRELIPRLKTEGSSRLEAIRALGYQGEAALDILVEFVEQGDAPVRAAALSALGHIPSPESTRRIEESLKDTNREVRDALIRTLALLAATDRERLFSIMAPIGDGSEIEALLATHPFPDSYRVEIAEPAGREIGPRAGVHADKGAIVKFLERMGTSGVDQLLAALKQDTTALKQERTATKVVAIRYLSYVREERVFEALLGELQTREAEVRAAVVTALGSWENKRAVDPLRKLLKDRDRKVRSGARAALARLNEKLG